jgi:Rha family phage regulatory protein
MMEDDQVVANLPEASSEILKPHLVMRDGRASTTSMAIAKHFGKRHDNVIQSIDNLDCSEEFRLLNFKETVYHRPNPSGGKAIEARMFEITRDGFAFLAMGFTGAKAAAWKEAYIAAFNAMEQALLARMQSDLEKTTQECRWIDRHRVDAVWRHKRLLDGYQRRETWLEQLARENASKQATLKRVSSRITGLEEFGALMAVTRLRSVDAMVLGYLLRRCAVESRMGVAWVEATVPHICSALNWNSTYQVAGALKQLEQDELIRCLRQGARRRLYFADPNVVVERLQVVLDDVGTPEGLIAVPDSLSPLAPGLRDLLPVTTEVAGGCLVSAEEAERIGRLRGDDGSKPRSRHLRLVRTPKKQST